MMIMFVFWYGVAMLTRIQMDYYEDCQFSRYYKLTYGIVILAICAPFLYILTRAITVIMVIVKENREKREAAERSAGYSPVPQSAAAH